MARKILSKRTRFAVLHSCGFKCVACGASPNDGDVRLQIDHIVPVAEGGTNDFENLQVLCRDCNYGKSDGILKIKPEIKRLSGPPVKRKRKRTQTNTKKPTEAALKKLKERNDIVKKEAEKRRKEITTLMLFNPFMTDKEISKKTGLSNSTISKYARQKSFIRNKAFFIEKLNQIDEKKIPSPYVVANYLKEKWSLSYQSCRTVIRIKIEKIKQTKKEIAEKQQIENLNIPRLTGKAGIRMFDLLNVLIEIQNSNIKSV